MYINGLTFHDFDGVQVSMPTYIEMKQLLGIPNKPPQVYW